MGTLSKRPPGTLRCLGLAAVLLLAGPLGARAQTDDPCAVTGAETARTDRPHYLAFETVFVSGRAYAPSCDYTIRVDGPAGSSATRVTSDPAGNLAATYDLGALPGDYSIFVVSSGSLVAARAGFTSGTYVMADRAEYAPHDPVTLSGRGWEPGETVQLVLHEEPATHPDRILTTTADASGSFLDTSFSPEQHDAGVAFTLTATGSLATAQTTFGDSAVAFDSASSGMSSGDVATSVSFPHTIGNGNNRLLMVTISTRPNVPSNVKYGGVAMTSLGVFTNSNPIASLRPRVEFFYLKNPPTGTANVTYNVTAGSVAGSVSFSGVYQPVPFGSSSGAFGTSPGCAGAELTACGDPQPTVALLNGPNDLILDALSISVGTGTSAVAVGADQTKQWDIRQGAPTIRMRGAGSTKAATGFVTSTSWTLSASGGDGSPAWVLGAIAIQAVFPADEFDVTTSVTTTTAGSSFNMTLTALDQYYNTATTYAGTVRFTSTDGQAVLPADYTFSPGDNGSHTFTGVVLKTVGTWKITATDTSDDYLYGTSPNIKVNASALDHLTLAPASASIPQGGSQGYTAAGLDAYNNSLGDMTGQTVFGIAPDGSCVGATCTANAAGPHTVTGNVSGKLGTATLLVLDTTPPETTISSAPPDPANSGTATFSFTGSDNVTAPASLSFRCQLDGAGFSDCSSPKSYGGLAEGSHVFQVRAADEAGNTDATAASHAWTILSPNTPPSITGLSTTPNPVNEMDPMTLAVSFADPDAADTHTVTIVWGDGSPNTAVELGAGVTTFSTEHGYLDDDPTGTAQDAFTIVVTVSDKAGTSDTRLATIAVANVAPVLSGVAGPAGPILLGVAATVRADFTDVGTRDTHTCAFAWNDTPVPTESAGAVTKSNGNGSCEASHTYAAAGVYPVDITVADDDNGTARGSFQYVVVYDPNNRFVTGGGWVNSPAGAYAADPSLAGKLSFGFNSKYDQDKPGPTGDLQLQFQAGHNFKSTSYDWLVITSYKAQCHGRGTINGAGNYAFLITAIDGRKTGGGGLDRFRIKIYDLDRNGAVIYDNEANTSDIADPTTPLGGGSIAIHD
jgi:hypothetical protein